MTELLESTESSSPLITRALAAAHRGVFLDTYQLPAWQRAAVRLVSGFPQRFIRFLTSRIQLLGGQDPSLLEGFSINRLIQTRLDDYAQLNATFPALTIGVGQAGSTSSLTMALGGLYLPQTFVVSLRGGSYHGDVHEYLDRSLGQALHIARENPSLLTIQHYDPIHDGWLTRFLNHLRFKLLDLPEIYRDFIRTHLEPGGAIVYLEGGASWLRYRLGERSVLQVGGGGGIPPDEYLEGSERIRRYATSIGLTQTDWRLPEYPLEPGAESEWGSEPGLAESVEAFCHIEGYRFVRIHMDQPHGFSRLAFATMRRLLEKEGREPAGTLVEMFSQFDTTASLESGLLPLWLIFNTGDALDFLREMKPQFPSDKPVFFSPLSTFSVTPDLVPYQSWEQTLPGFINIGAAEKRYPADLRALVDWSAPLHDWVAAHRQPVRARLQAEELLEIAAGMKKA